MRKKGKGGQGGKGRLTGQVKGHGRGQTNSGQVSLEKNHSDGPKSRFPSNLYCKAKQKPALDQVHWLNNFSQLTALNKKELVQMLPNVCLGCLRKKISNKVQKFTVCI